MFKIVRHCSERLPHGIRAWVKVARRAGFRGTLYVRGFKPRDDEPNGRILLGHQKGDRIVVRVQSRCGNATVQGYDPLRTFAHELGHWHRYTKGMKVTNGRAFKNNAEQAADPIEAYCDRFAARLLKGIV